MPTSNEKENMVLSYLTMRRFLGVLGFSLPFVLLIGGLMTENYLRPSISSFYHSPSPILHGFFVGSLCALGVFLISYKGYKRRKDELFSDDKVADAIGIGAIGIALAPIDEEFFFRGHGLCVSIPYEWIHYGSVLLFFSATVFMLYCKFTRTYEKGSEPRQRSEHELFWKQVRNAIYQVCAAVIIVCVLALVLLFVTEWLFGKGSALIGECSVVFWLESFAIWAFGVAWLAKGKVSLLDRRRHVQE